MFFLPKFNTWPEWVFVVPPSGGFVGGPNNVTKTILFEPVAQEIFILQMIFKNFWVAPISSMLHRCAGVTFPWFREHAVLVPSKMIKYQMNFNNFTSYDHATIKNLGVTIGFGHFSVLAWILLHVDDRLRLSYFTWCHLFHFFQMKYQRFRVDIVRLCLRQSHRSTTTKLNADAFKSARAPKVLLCVTFFAPFLGSTFRLISGCSKYVTFSIIFGALVLQTTVCVAFGARRRAAPARLLGGALATSCDGAGPEVWQERVPPGFPGSMSPEGARIHAATHHPEQFLRGRKWYPPQG